MPMTLRSCGRDTVPMIGPRSRAVAAPQWIGNQLGARLRMRGQADMVSPIGTVIATVPPNGDGPPERRAWSPTMELTRYSRIYKYSYIATEYNGNSHAAFVGRPIGVTRPFNSFGPVPAGY